MKSSKFSDPTLILALKELKKTLSKAVLVQGSNASNELWRNLFCMPNNFVNILEFEIAKKQVLPYGFEPFGTSEVYLCATTFCSSPQNEIRGVIDFLKEN